MSASTRLPSRRHAARVGGSNLAWTQGPNIADFTTFIYSVVKIPQSVLPPSDPTIGYAYAVAFEIVNPAIGTASAILYSQAVYNLGVSNIINFAQDQPGAPDVEGSNPPQPYFANLRTQWKINNFVAGEVSSSSDEGTSQSLEVPEWVKKMSLAELQYVKDPYGRQYLAIAQRYGTLWGLT